MKGRAAWLAVFCHCYLLHAICVQALFSALCIASLRVRRARLFQVFGT